MTTAENYRCLLKDIHEISLRCNREPSDISLVVVSKFKSIDQIGEVYNAGAREFGENRVQEALEKIPNAPSDIQWHLIGTLQKNKVRKVIGKFHLIHSVDSLELAEKISKVSLDMDLTSSILLEVNVSGEATKHGFSSDDLRKQWKGLSRLPHISIEGLMTMAPYTDDESVIRSCFIGLRELKEELRLNHLSMGMTHDYRIAIEEGATILRIGSAVFEG